MITIDQLRSEIENISSYDVEVVYQIVQLLQAKNKKKRVDNSINPLKGSVIYEKDIISSVDEAWNVDL